MEGSTEAPDPKPRTFSQVVFTDTPHSYPPSTPITCCFTLTAAFQPSPRDWVGIFKVGWSTTKDYHTFVWVEPSLDVVGQETAMRQAVFKEYYLPKDEIEFYQFCYVDSTGQVRGASTPFCFKRTEEQSLESSPDDDLLVITTQEQVEQSVREKAELQKELDQIRAQNETLKINLQKTQQEAASLKGQNDQKEKEMSQLGREMDQIKEQNESLKSTVQQQQQETESLKVQEKYDRAVMKINQLKEERDQLKGKIDVQGVEIVMLNSKLREQERELLKMKDSVQLLQVDLQSTEKEKERLSAEMQKLQILTHNVDGLQTENRELCRRLSEQEALQSCPDDDLRVKCQSLVSQLQDAQTKLSAEREETKNIRRHNEFLDGELLQLRGQMEKVVEVCEQTERRSGKQEMQLREAHEAIADKNMLLEEKEHLMMLVKKEKEELARENQALMSDMEGLRRVNADLSAAPRADTPQSQPDPTSPAAAAPPAQEQAEDMYQNIGILAEEGEEEEEQSLVCRHCQECFPGITRHELEQHEQSHRVCPFCTVICDNMEQAVFEDHVYGHEL